jgi:hypothetical protein
MQKQSFQLSGRTSEEIPCERLELPNLQLREIRGFRLQIAHQQKPLARFRRPNDQTRTAALSLATVRDALLEQTATQIRVHQTAREFSDGSAATRLVEPDVPTPSPEFSRRVRATKYYTIG